MPTFLLTWSKFAFEDLPKIARQVATGESVGTNWSTGSRKDFPPGSEFLFLRLGKDPRGVIGYGKIHGEVYEEKHWDPDRAAAGETARQRSKKTARPALPRKDNSSAR